MSSEALPITTNRFAAALKDLPLSSLHTKVAELRNSLSNLKRSNAELEEYIRKEGDGGSEDRELMEVILENREVMKRFEERIELIRIEVVEVRGMPFVEEDPTEVKREGVDGEAGADVEMTNGDAPARNDGNSATLQNGQNQEEEGVFL